MPRTRPQRTSDHDAEPLAEAGQPENPDEGCKQRLREAGDGGAQTEDRPAEEPEHAARRDRG